MSSSSSSSSSSSRNSIGTSENRWQTTRRRHTHDMDWKDGRCVTWDVTVTDTMAQSYLPLTSQTSGAAAEAAADRKTAKYAPLTQRHIKVTRFYVEFLLFFMFCHISQLRAKFCSMSTVVPIHRYVG